MGVPSKCTIVRATGRAAYSPKQNPQKKQLCSVSVKKALSGTRISTVNSI